jgi:hypothetical protein
MIIESLLAAVITLLGGVVSAMRFRRSRGSVLEATEEEATEQRRARTLMSVLFWFTIAFAVLTAGRYWHELWTHLDDVIFSIWLAITMVVGMLVQVLAANYRSTSKLMPVTFDRLIFPLLFSIIVFYPIWALAASAPRNFFVFHAAFLNGYFWEHVVSTTQPPGTSAGRVAKTKRASPKQ